MLKKLVVLIVMLLILQPLYGMAYTLVLSTPRSDDTEC